MGGDFNCTTSLIPRYSTNARVVDFEDLVTQACLMVINNSKPTWHRGKHESINDYILTKGIAAREYQTLKGEEDLCSDQYFINFKIEFEAPSHNPIFWTDPAAIQKQVIATPHPAHWSRHGWLCRKPLIQPVGLHRDSFQAVQDPTLQTPMVDAGPDQAQESAPHNLSLHQTSLECGEPGRQGVHHSTPNC